MKIVRSPSVLIGSAIVGVLLALVLFLFSKDRGSRRIKFAFDVGRWSRIEDRLRFENFVWTSNGRSRCLLLANIPPSHYPNSTTIWRDSDMLMQLIDARGGSGASDISEVRDLFETGGFVVREQDGGLVGFADSTQEWMLFVQK